MKRFVVVLAVVVSAFPLRSAAQLTSAQQSASLVKLQSAWDEIDRNPRDAMHIFAAELHIWAAFSRQSVGYIDADRGSLIAAVLAGDDASAEAAWQRIQGETHGVVAEPEPSGDVQAWNTDWAGAFRAYRDLANFGADDCLRQTNRGLDEAISGHLSQARETWAYPQSCLGPHDVTDVDLALTGDTFAAERRWMKARSTWIEAARRGRVVPQIDMLYAGNVMALSMLYHFRHRFGDRTQPSASPMHKGVR
jgi:hypothetical protein